MTGCANSMERRSPDSWKVSAPQVPHFAFSLTASRHNFRATEHTQLVLVHRNDGNISRNE